MQPVVIDKHGVHRFKANPIVRYLLDHGRLDMNDIAVLPFDNEDRVHFHQLIGYSVSGAGCLLNQMPDGGEVIDPAYDVATPGNSDGEVIARCLDISYELWKDTSVDVSVAAQTAIRKVSCALEGSPSGKRHEIKTSG